MIGRRARPWMLQGDGRIEVARDGHGVPHVRVGTEADLYRGLGYCHGRDRGLQILLTRVLASGRASELLESSDEMLAFDRFFRRVNFAAAIDAEVAKLTPADRALGDAYCDGLNRAFARRTPWELKLAGYRPAPWSLRDSIVISRAMGYVQTAQHQADIERLIVEMVQADVPAAHLENLFPGLLAGLDQSLLAQVRLGERLVPDSVRWGVGIPRAIASNNWVLSAAKTASGQAMLASDPHLEANRLPAVWYESVLEVGDRFCFNATIPGLPFCAIARTNDLAWAPTYAPIDAVDSWIEDCRDGCYRRVENRMDTWEPFRERTEVIKRKNAPDEVATFYENDHGVLDGDPFESGLYLTTAWSAGSSTGATSLKSGFGMFFAADVDSGMAHLGEIESSWNWVLADRHANIAYQMSGRMPLRAPGCSGLIPLPGWDPENDWKGLAPASDLARARNPEAGFIATANNDLNHLGERAPINLPMGSHRAERIAELLASRDDWTSELAQQMQMDVYSRQAAQFLAILRPLLPAGPQAQALAAWDLCYDPGSQAATLFERFYRKLVLEVFGRACGGEVMRFLVDETGVLAGFYANFDRVLLDPESPWYGEEGRDATFARIASTELGHPAEPWGACQQFTMKHLMFGDKLPNWLGFNHGPITLRGGRATIHQGQIFRVGGRETNWAPSYRFITDLAEAATSSALAGGPSDRRFSRLYTSGVADWAAGRFKTLTKTR